MNIVVLAIYIDTYKIMYWVHDIKAEVNRPRRVKETARKGGKKDGKGICVAYRMKLNK